MNKQWNIHWGRAGGHLVCVLAFYFDDLNSNPAEVLSFFLIKFCLKIMRVKQKKPGLAPSFPQLKDIFVSA